MYANSGNLAEYIQPGSISIVEKTLSTLIKVTNADDIAIEYVQGVYTLIEDFEQHTSDADIHITAEERDYWNESIEDTRESTVSFDEASAYSELVSGDTHATLFGKIKAFFKNAVIYNSLTLGRRKEGSRVGVFSIASGSNCEASGYASVAIGAGNVASHAYSQAVGYYTKTSKFGQAVFGNYNIARTYTLFEVGNGISDTERENMMEVTEDGEVKAKKDFIANGISLIDTKNAVGNIGSIARGFGNIGSDACNAVIYSNIILKRTGTGKCDLIISGKVESITADSSCFNVFDMSKLRNLIGISNISFDPAHTTVMLEQRFLSANQANSGHYGYGQMFDGATIGRFHTTDGALGGWSSSHGVYTPGTYFIINIYGATYN